MEFIKQKVNMPEQRFLIEWSGDPSKAAMNNLRM